MTGSAVLKTRLSRPEITSLRPSWRSSWSYRVTEPQISRPTCVDRRCFH